MSLPDPDTRVPPGDEAVRCPRCDRPFRGERARDLHVGEAHDDLDASERERYEAALERERDDLWLFHAKAVVALGVTYALTVVLYMVALGSGFL